MVEQPTSSGTAARRSGSQPTRLPTPTPGSGWRQSQYSIAGRSSPPRRTVAGEVLRGPCIDAGRRGGRPADVLHLSSGRPSLGRDPCGRRPRRLDGRSGSRRRPSSDRSMVPRKETRRTTRETCPPPTSVLPFCCPRYGHRRRLPRKTLPGGPGRLRMRDRSWR